MRLATASGPVSSSRLIRPRRTAAVARGSADLASPINPRQALSFLTASVRNGSRTQATIRSALRPSRPSTGLDGIPESRRLFRVGLRRCPWRHQLSIFEHWLIGTA